MTLVIKNNEFCPGKCGQLIQMTLINVIDLSNSRHSFLLYG